MHTPFFHYGSSRIKYSRWGTGNKLLLCFHGYGESADAFAFLEDALGREFTILAIDLPFHGGTEWKEGPLFRLKDLLAILDGIVRDTGGPNGDGVEGDAAETGAAEGGASGAGRKWTLLGYSMGGRVALSLLEKVPEKIGKLVLVGPDGLKMNGWYWLATQNAPGRALFRWTMKNPGWFFFFLKVADRLRLVNRSIYKFTVNYIGEPRVREELYQRWTAMRTFRPDIPVIQSQIRRQEIPVRLLYGRYDRIIRWETGAKFNKEIGPACRLVILETGHHLLQEKNADTLLGLLMD
jgi:pimeloyl-ACP methyl ester carboxylesterase